MEQGQSEYLIIDFEQDFGGVFQFLKLLEGVTHWKLSGSHAGVSFRQFMKSGVQGFEANVRSFLQARGKVNKGIRDTIVMNPTCFFPIITD